MAEQADWAFPLEMRPRPEDWRFDLDAALGSVVQLRAEIPDDAFTAPILGTERAGNGIVIREDGLVLTIGYLITEASTIWLTTNQGAVTGGFPVAYDQATGFGLVQPLGRLGARASSMGRRRADRRRRQAARHRLAPGAGKDRQRDAAGQHGGADRPARADPRRHGENRALSPSFASLARHVHHRGRQEARRGGPRARRPGRARRHEDR